MKKYLFFTFIFIYFSLYAGWMKTYGGSYLDDGFSVKQTLDGGYIITGTTYSYGVGGDLYLIKTDFNGDTTWTKNFGGSSWDVGYSVDQTTDGGYIIAGSTSSYGAGLTDVYLIKTDANGDTSWTKTFGSSDVEVGYSIDQTSDGGYIIAGYTNSYGAGLNDAYLIKTDSNGDTSWTKTFGGSLNDYSYSVQQTTDGGYITAGYTNSYGAGYEDFYLIKTNANGDTSWTKTYGGTGCDWGQSVRQTDDGGYIIAGYTDSDGIGGDLYLIKTNTSGNISWIKNYGGSSCEWGNSVFQTTDGGYIVTGYTYSYGAGQSDVYLIKTDANGDSLWTKTYGGSDNDEGHSVQQTSDGGYIIVGITSSYGAGGADVYLIKTNENGLIVNELILSNPSEFSYSLDYVVSNMIQFKFALPQEDRVEINIYDAAGRYISTPASGRYAAGKHNIDVPIDYPGIYFYTIESEQFKDSGKFIVVE